MYVRHVCLVPAQARRGCHVAMELELHLGASWSCCETNQGPLHKHQVLITAESSLQPHWAYCAFNLAVFLFCLNPLVKQSKKIVLISVCPEDGPLLEVYI